MRKLFFISIAAFMFACNDKPQNASDIKLDEFKQRLSYALGADMAGSFSNMPPELMDQLSVNDMEQGFYDMLTADDSENTNECRDILQVALSQPQGIDTTQNTKQEISHCYGMVFGEMLRKSLNSKNALQELDADVAKIGFRSGLDQVDTLIPIEERQEMIMKFNEDMSKLAGEEFISAKSEEHAEKLADEGYILLEEAGGESTPIDLSMEYDIIYTLTDITGDTIFSTVKDPSLSDEENSQVVNTDDIVFPEVWKLAAGKMRVGGDYTIFSPYELAYGTEGLKSPRGPNYIIPPYTAVVIHSKVLGQYPRNYLIKERGQKVIEEAKKLPNTIVDESGFVLSTLEEGDGPYVPEGSDVKAHYILTNSKGEMVENSYMSQMKSNKPAPSFSLNQVVKGWQLAVPKMRKGGRYQLVLPYDLAYGEQGNQGVQPFETLTFEMEILDFGEPGSLVQPRPQQQLSPEQMQQLQQQMQQQQGQ